MNETKSNVRNAIKDVISELMENVLNSVLVKNPFISERFHAEKPLYAALVPDEIFKGSHFERRFVTRFGNTWEKLAFVVANANMGGATLQAKIDGNILEGRLKRIQEILNAEDHGTKENKKRKPNWEEDLKYVLKGKGEPIPCQVVCDLLVEDKRTNKKYAFELKAPLPNSDQTKVSKEKMLKLMSMDNHPVEEAFLGLVYNPWGIRDKYEWSFPKKWFDLKNDKSLLIGDELWDFLGGKGTYQKFISEINKLGRKYKEQIYKDYLGIEPIEEILNINLK